MKSKVGVWIDHRHAFVAFVDEAIKVYESGVEKDVRYSGHARNEEGIAENQADRQFHKHLNDYYDRVIDAIESAKFILLFGPGEAKGEFKARLQKRKLDPRIVHMETVDKMTPDEIMKKTHKYFVKDEVF